MGQGAMRGFVEFGAITMPNPPRWFHSLTERALVAAGSRAMLAVDRVLRAFNGRDAA